MVPTDAERLRRLAAWERVFGDPAFSTGRAWRGPSPDVVRFTEEMAELGWSTRPDHAAWAATPEGHELLDDDQLVLRASADELALLLTTIIRGDRFSAGVMDAAFARGTMLRIARRARVLLWTTVNQPDPAQT